MPAAAPMRPAVAFRELAPVVGPEPSSLTAGVARIARSVWKLSSDPPWQGPRVSGVAPAPRVRPHPGASATHCSLMSATGNRSSPLGEMMARRMARYLSCSPVSTFATVPCAEIPNVFLPLSVLTKWQSPPPGATSQSGVPRRCGLAWESWWVAQVSDC
jgi:hypothetical protein